jgi:hypothetical protein
VKSEALINTIIINDQQQQQQQKQQQKITNHFRLSPKPLVLVCSSTFGYLTFLLPTR